MKYLRKDQLHLVKPMFQNTVQTAWNNGEEVPASVALLSDAPITDEDVKWAEKVVKKHKLT